MEGGSLDEANVQFVRTIIFVFKERTPLKIRFCMVQWKQIIKTNFVQKASKHSKEIDINSELSYDNQQIQHSTDNDTPINQTNYTIMNSK